MPQQETRSLPSAARSHAAPSTASVLGGTLGDRGAPAPAWTWLGLVLLALPFVFWVLRRSINLDFWYDEVYTLDHFVFVPLFKTLTDYSQPNNHILFNLLNNLYVSCLGLRDTYEAMDSPWVLRIPPLLYAAGALGFTFQAARRCGGAAAGLLAVIVLATTVPFFHFAAQVRGYSLSMLLLTAMVYFLLCREEDGRPWHAIATSAAGSLALYTIPSNLYFLLSVAAFYLAAALLHAAGGPAPRAPLEPHTAASDVPPGVPAATHATGFLRRLCNRYLVGTLLMAASAGGAVVLYLPVLPQLLSSAALRPGSRFEAAVLTQLMPQMFLYLISGRYALLLLPLAAVLAAVLARSRCAEDGLWRRWLFCLALLVLPFVWSWARGDRPPDRVFVNLAPVFALFVAISGRIAWGRLPARRGPALAGIAVAAVYGYAVFGLSVRAVDRRLLADIEQGCKSQDAFYAYYQAYYRPCGVMKELLARYATDPAPVYLYEYGDQVAMFRYMQKTRLLCFTARDPSQIELGPNGLAYVVTAWPRKYQRQIAEARGSLSCEVVTPQPAFCGLLVCRGR
jgi:hypothetical protein